SDALLGGSSDSRALAGRRAAGAGMAVPRAARPAAALAQDHARGGSTVALDPRRLRPPMRRAALGRAARESGGRLAAPLRSLSADHRAAGRSRGLAGGSPPSGRASRAGARGAA